MSEPLLAVRDAVKLYSTSSGLRSRSEKTRAVDGVSFELERGGSLGVVGESGSGKSTLARLVVGLEPPSSGSIRIDGQEIAGRSSRELRPLRRRLQMVFQDPYGSLDPRQRVLACLVEPMEVQRIGRARERRLRALAALDAVGLAAEHALRYPHELSGGQRQRVAIARALVLEPELLVLDEPVSALDVSIQAQVLNLLCELRLRFGLSYLLIAHDLAVVRRLCPRVAVMYCGRIVELAPREWLYSSPQHPYTRWLLSAVPVPDPRIERGRTRVVLPGEPPSPSDPPSGCAFHPRCPEHTRVPGDLCRIRRPELSGVATQAEHVAACHLVNPHSALRS